MADIGASLLTNLLFGAEGLAKENSPYNPFSQAADLVGKTVIAGSPQFDIGESVLAGLLTGLVGGGAQQLTQNYADNQVDMLNDLLKGHSTGNILEKPEGMDRSIFEKAESMANIFDLNAQEEERRGKLATAQAVDQAKQLAQAEREIAVQRYGPMGLLPPGLQDNVMAQTATAQENRNVELFIDEQFEKAKTIPSLQALAPGSTAANEMNGIAITLTTALQKALGREMNAKEQERLQGAVPDWNDTADQIELKKQRFKDLMQTISKSTPLAIQDPRDNRIDLGGQSSVGEIPPGMKLQRNARTGETRLVPQ